MKPIDRIARGYAADDVNAARRDQSIAGLHRPDESAEADRLAKLDPLPPLVRLQVGYARRAAAAARRVARHNPDDQGAA